MKETFSLYTDGGSRNNPGPAAIGGIIKAPDGSAVARFKDFIGIATNNVAEYTALVRGLSVAGAHNIANLNCYLDSELVVRQLNGEYRVKDVNLKFLYKRVKKLAASFNMVTFNYIPRRENKEADKLVNEALVN